MGIALGKAHCQVRPQDQRALDLWVGPCSARNPGVLKGASLRASQGRLPGGAVPRVGFQRSSKSGREGKGAPDRENSLCEGLEVRLPALPARGLEHACSFFFPFSSALPPPLLLGALCSVLLPLILSPFPLSLLSCFGVHLAMAGSHLPIPCVRQGRAVRGVLFLSLCPPDARPLWGVLCLLLGLCEPVCAHTCVWEPRAAPCRLGALGVRTLPSATPDPLYYPSYIMVGGRRGSLLKGIAVASWRSTLVKGDLSPSSQPPSKMSLGLDTGRGLEAGRLGCSLALPPRPACPACPCPL